MTEDRKSLLVVEDDAATAEFLSDNLAVDGFHVATASGAGEAIRRMQVSAPDLLVLDLVLEDGSGLTVLDQVRAADGLASRIDPDLPVLVLSGRSSDVDRVRGFTRGADDYLVKPFSYAELVARVHALLRRAGSRRHAGVIRVGDLTLDPATRAVRLAGEPIELSPKEFSLLHALAQEPDRVHTKHELLRDVWGYRAHGATRTLDAHACRLRKKLGASARPLVLNVRGVGYRLAERP
ncbi:MAG: response regulator transcription factor [Thermoleophilaceae bacterium]